MALRRVRSPVMMAVLWRRLIRRFLLWIGGCFSGWLLGVRAVGWIQNQRSREQQKIQNTLHSLVSFLQQDLDASPGTRLRSRKHRREMCGLGCIVAPKNPPPLGHGESSTCDWIRTQADRASLGVPTEPLGFCGSHRELELITKFRPEPYIPMPLRLHLVTKKSPRAQAHRNSRLLNDNQNSRFGCTQTMQVRRGPIPGSLLSSRPSAVRATGWYRVGWQ